MTLSGHVKTPHSHNQRSSMQCMAMEGLQGSTLAVAQLVLASHVQPRACLLAPWLSPHASLLGTDR